MVVAFSALVAQFESQFTAVAGQHLEDEKKKDKGGPVVAAETCGGWNIVTGQSGNYLPSLILDIIRKHYFYNRNIHIQSNLY